MRALNFSFTMADYIVLISGYALSMTILLLGVIPYLSNPKKRKQNNFKVINVFFYLLLIFLSVAIINYGINSLFGLTVANFSSYYVTFLFPIILAFNLILIPFINKIVLLNKAVY